MPRVFDRHLCPVVLCAGLLATAGPTACSGKTDATTPPPSPSASAIDSARMLGLLGDLADDALGGRYTLHPDIYAASALITAQYEAAGVHPGSDAGFEVKYDVRVGIDPGPGSALVVATGGKETTVDPTALIPLAEGGTGRAEGPLVFVGYGIVHDPNTDGFDELAAVDLKGAIAVVLSGTPPAAENGPSFGRRDGTLSRKLARLEQAGAAGVIVIDPLAVAFDDPSIDRPLRHQVKIPVVQLAAQAKAPMLTTVDKLREQIDRTTMPASRALAKMRVQVVADFTARTVEAPNVIAMVPGGERADEIVLVGAHLDHIGTDEPGHGHCTAVAQPTADAICNGADDNGSGSAIVAELAMSFATQPTPPTRTMVFVHFSGEEMGLLGSRHLATQLDTQAPFAGRRIVAMLNIDMVGRLRERLTVSGVGSSDAWMPLLDEIGPRDMRVMYDRSLTTRSDHAPFYEQQIPALFFFTGVHDDYHAPGDEMAEILPDGLVSVAGLVHEIARRLGDGHPIAFSEPQRPEFGLVPALPGDIPEAVIKEVGPATP